MRVGGGVGRISWCKIFFSLTSGVDNFFRATKLCTNYVSSVASDFFPGPSLIIG